MATGPGVADTRRVQRLRLRCGDAGQAAQAARVAQSLGDALRCATLPSAPGRVLLVRRLALGRLPPGGNAVTLTLHLQAAVQRAGWHWVRGDTPAAASAPAVWFAHAAHAAAAAWAWRVAGRSLDAWYWPLALPGLPLSAPLGTLRPALRAWLDTQVGEGAGAAWWPQDGDSATPREAAAEPPSAWSRAVDVRASVAAASLQPMRRNAQLIGPVNPPASRRDDAANGEPALHRVVSSAHDTNRVPGVERPGRHDNGALLEPQAPPRAGDPVATRIPKALAARVPASPHDEVPRSLTDDLAPGAIPSNTAEAAPLSRPVEAHAGPRPAFTGLESLDTFTAPPRATALGGVLLLLPALRQTGWLAEPRSAADFAALASEAIARLRVRGDDPVHALIAHLADGESLAPRAAAARAQWRALRRWLRHTVRIGPAHLLARPAHVRWDATHIDLHFALNHADLRVRRAGLDQSPGWLPWLGRVVTVHFGDVADLS